MFVASHCPYDRGERVNVHLFRREQRISFEEGDHTLEKCAALRGKPGASDLAFLAMARQKLGETAIARDVLEKLRALMKQPDNAQNKELQGFLREAEALIAGGAVTPASAAAGRK